MGKDCYSIGIGNEVARMSAEFEQNNSDLKRKYLIYNIFLYNYIVESVSGGVNCGSFGTGYPFYALRSDLSGTLPVIDEHIRYSNDLIGAVINSKYTKWTCAMCLSQNADSMPDLKQICKPCPNMDDALKPRKILNRLPDMDMWMVCKDDSIEFAKEQLITLFSENGMYSSDTNPLQTISDVQEIIEDLKKGIMPKKLLPLDTHLIDHSTISSLIEQVPYSLKKASMDSQIPYLPIHPLSYRKEWQHDDTAYNFVHDYLSSLTEFDFRDDLKQLLRETRNVIANSYSFEQLYNYLIETGPTSVERRHKTLVLKERFRERINSWKR